MLQPDLAIIRSFITINGKHCIYLQYICPYKDLVYIIKLIYDLIIHEGKGKVFPSTGLGGP
jgi:hypothetical protein